VLIQRLTRWELPRKVSDVRWNSARDCVKKSTRTTFRKALVLKEIRVSMQTFLTAVSSLCALPDLLSHRGSHAAHDHDS
jgi:hypothetical protein